MLADRREDRSDEVAAEIDLAFAPSRTSAETRHAYRETLQGRLAREVKAFRSLIAMIAG